MKEIAELSEVVQRAPNTDTLYAALRHIRSATSVAQGLSVIGNDHQYLQTRTYPSNKHSEKQKRFFSTKCKRKVKRPKISLSDSAAQQIDQTEPEVCAFCFKEDPPSKNSETVEWVECSACKVWVHTECDNIEDKDTYVCCMCRP